MGPLDRSSGTPSWSPYLCTVVCGTCDVSRLLQGERVMLSGMLWRMQGLDAA